MGDNEVMTGEDVADAGVDETAGEEELSTPDSGEEELQQPPDAITSQVEAFKTAMETERYKRQQIEGQLQMMQNMLMQQRQHKPEEETLSPDDVPTLREIDKYIEKKLGERVDPRFNSGQEMLVKMADNLARQRYDDYDVTIDLFHELNNADHTGKLREYVLGQPDPAEAAYRLGMTHPRYSQSKTVEGNKNIAAKIKRNMNTVPTLSNAGGGASSTKNAIKAIEDMSFDEINSEIAKIMNKVG